MVWPATDDRFPAAKPNVNVYISCMNLYNIQIDWCCWVIPWGSFVPYICRYVNVMYRLNVVVHLLKLCRCAFCFCCRLKCMCMNLPDFVPVLLESASSNSNLLVV